MAPKAASKKDPKKDAEGGEKKEKKKRPKRDDDDEDVCMWDSVGVVKDKDLTISASYLTNEKEKALDKRNKDVKQANTKINLKADTSEDGGSSMVGDLLKKKEQSQAKAAEEKEKKKAEKAKANDMFGGLDAINEDDDRQDEELDLNGESNVLDNRGKILQGRHVSDIMATGTFKYIKCYTSMEEKDNDQTIKVSGSGDTPSPAAPSSPGSSSKSGAAANSTAGGSKPTVGTAGSPTHNYKADAKTTGLFAVQRNISRNAVRLGGGVEKGKDETWVSLGNFTPQNGFTYLRINTAMKVLRFSCLRQSSIYVCSLKKTDETCKKWVQYAEVHKFPETSAGVYTNIRKKTILTSDDTTFEFTKPLGEYLVFYQPDCTQPTFAEEAALAHLQDADGDGNIGGANDFSNIQQSVQDHSTLEKTLDQKVQELKEKQERGEKLTAKEKKMLERNTLEAKYHNPDDDEAIGNMNAFALTLPGGKVVHPPSGDSAGVEGFSLSAAGKVLFKEATLKITAGHRYGFLGPNGMGKTTILRHIAKREFPVPLDWDILLVEQEAKASNKNVVEEVMSAEAVSMQLIEEEAQLMEKLEQAADDAEKGLPDKFTADELEKLRLRLEEVATDLAARNANSMESTVRKILTGLGFTKKMLTQTVQTFSGGWRMRISLAKALFIQPKLLLLDEPTNHLDLDAVLWLDNYLSEVYPYTVMCVSHDADFLDAICTDVIHLDNQQLLYYRGGYSAFCKMRQQKKSAHEKELKKMQDEFKALKRSGVAKDKAEEQVKKKFKLDSIDQIHEKPKDYIVKFHFHGLGRDSAIGGLNVSDVAFSYNGEKPYLLDSLDFGCDCTSRIAIVGPNGVGKSTFLNLMMKKLEPCEGTVRHAQALRVGHYHQHFAELLPMEKSGVEYLQSAFRSAGITSDEKARAALGQFGLPSFAHMTKIGNLSGGQKARVAFAALSLAKPHIVVLDEPTNHLDIESVEALIDSIEAFDGGVILVTHDARLIQAVDATLWVVGLHDEEFKPETAQIKRHERGFEGYRFDVLKSLAEREEEIERTARERAAEKEKKREALGVKVREDAEAAAALAAKKAVKRVEKPTDDQIFDENEEDSSSSPKDNNSPRSNEGNDDQDAKGKKKLTAKERQMLKKEQQKREAEEKAKEDAERRRQESAEAEETKRRLEKEQGPQIQLADLSSEDEDAKKKKKKKKEGGDEDLEAEFDTKALKEIKSLKKEKKRLKELQSYGENVDDDMDRVKAEIKQAEKDGRKRMELKREKAASEKEAKEKAEKEAKEAEKKAAAAKAKAAAADSDDDDDDDEVDFGKKKKKDKKDKKKAKKVESEDEEESDDEVDLAAFGKKRQPGNQIAKKEESEDQEEEESDDEIDITALAGNKGTKGKKPAPKEPSSEEEEEEEAPTPKKPETPTKKQEPARKEEINWDEEDGKKGKKAKNKAKAKQHKKNLKQSDDEDEDSKADKKESLLPPAGKKGDSNPLKANVEVKDTLSPAAKEPVKADDIDVQIGAGIEDEGEETQWTIGKVISVEGLKKKGNFQLEIDIGDPVEPLAVVSGNFPTLDDSVMAGSWVVVCKEGVVGPDGKEVKRQKVGGVWNCGLLLSCTQLGLLSQGGPKDCGVLDPNGDYSIGQNYVKKASFGGPSAPSEDAKKKGSKDSSLDDDGGKPGSSATGDDHLLDDEDDDDGGNKRGAAKNKKAKAKAKGEVGKKQKGAANITLEEEAPINWDEDDKKKKGKKKK